MFERNSTLEYNEKKNHGGSKLSMKEIENNYGFKLSDHDILKIRDKYKTDITDVKSLKKKLREKYVVIKKQAKHFAKKMLKRNPNKSLYEVLKKAYSQKQKMNYSDLEFEEFRRLYELYIYGKERKDHYNKTLMRKVFGNPFVAAKKFLSVESREKGDLIEILKLQELSKLLHNDVLQQSEIYTDCNMEALTGNYDRIHHNINCHVHPAIAAMFLPKINLFEQYMIQSNIGRIVKKKNDGSQLNIQGDIMLLHSLVSDPHDMVCYSDAPIKDLLYRYRLQINLWRSVLNLRNGKYFEKENMLLLQAIDTCRLFDVTSDEDDSNALRNEALIFKKIITSFCFKSVVVTTSMLPYIQGVDLTNRPLYGGSHVNQVYSLSMLTLKLPQHFQPFADDTIDLDYALTQPQIYYENGVPIPKYMVVIYVREVLIFYVPRRLYRLPFEQLQPLSFNEYPKFASGLYEEINETRVRFNVSMSITNKNYYLRSILAVNTFTDSKSNKKLITGSCAIVLPNPTNLPMFPAVRYDPIQATRNTKGQYPPPVTELDLESNDPIQDCVLTIGELRGTIFIYQDLKFD